jgi:uncharacterized membrane protein YeaQ/YmgE (transglycosylase-associated protein family)
MGCLSWIIFGGLAGWIASILTGRNSRMGCLANIAIGIIGALLGGLVMRFITGEPFDPSWSFTSFAVAVVGSVVLLALTGLYRPGRR